MRSSLFRFVSPFKLYLSSTLSTDFLGESFFVEKASNAAFDVFCGAAGAVDFVDKAVLKR